MAEKKKIKSLFEIARDALTNSDEKAAAEAKAAAEKEAAELASRRKAAEAAQARLKAKAEADKKAAEAKAAAEKLARENQLKAESKKRADEMMASAAAKAKAEADKKAAEAAAIEAAKPKVLAEYEIKAGDTLSAIALKYYKHATPPYYTLIYEANKAVIGDNMNVIHPGLKLQIPELPEELKGK